LSTVFQYNGHFLLAPSYMAAIYIQLNLKNSKTKQHAILLNQSSGNSEIKVKESIK
jgi:hypothetical protein